MTWEEWWEDLRQKVKARYGEDVDMGPPPPEPEPDPPPRRWTDQEWTEIGKVKVPF